MQNQELNPRSGSSILVVDDDDGIRNLFQDVLETAGYSVRLASDGEQALRILRTAFDVALVITDLVMPNKEGIETIRELRKNHPAVKIIAMSGSFASELDALRYLGADVVLPKPVMPETLELAVAQALAHAPC